MAFWLAMEGRSSFRLEPGVDVTIGRDQSCDVSVYSSLLSREHARVRWEEDQPILFDLDSLNGCYCGPDRISRHPLKRGDALRLGDLKLLFLESDQPPPPLKDDAHPAPSRDDLSDSGRETRVFSRTRALHEKVFEYDELAWLSEHLAEKARREVMDPSFLQRKHQPWGAEETPDLTWKLLELGILIPEEDTLILGATTPGVLSRRGERLRRKLLGAEVNWNEMASLRYHTRQGSIFQPLRLVARAYRPGGGLASLDLPHLVYELKNIYASELSPATLKLELRRLLCAGFLCPQPGARAEAWFPKTWEEAPVRIAPRGLAMLEGFRLET